MNQLPVAGHGACKDAALGAVSGRISESLQLRERLLAASARASRLLLEATNAMAAMPDVLRMLGEAAEADRTVLARTETRPSGERWLVTASEWISSSWLPSYSDERKLMWSEHECRSVCCELRAGRAVCIAQDSATEHGIASQHAKSSVIVPIQVDGEYAGAIGFDDYRQCREYDPAVVAALEIAAGVIGAALHRQKLIEAVQREREHAAEQRVAELARANAAIRGNLERLASEPDLRSFMGHVLLETTRQLGAAAGTVVLLNEAAAEWRAIAHVRDDHIAPVPFVESVPFGNELLDRLFSECTEPEIVDLERERCPWPGTWEYHHGAGHASMYVLPLKFGDRNVGFFVLAFRDGRSIDLRGGEMLVALAQQATLAIELTRLASSAQEAAVLAERNRIGQEIHDGLAQAFTGILLQLGAAEELHAFEPGSPLAPALTRVREMAREGLAEARRSVLALRPDRARLAGLEQALRELADRATIPGRVVCTFEGAGAATGLPTEHEHELLRIAQEAVSNAVRHARPRTVRIAIAEESSHWVLTIADDGQGMEHLPALYARQGFGLTNMRERAQAIGALWQIDSRPGEGTRIRVQLPRRAAA